MLPECKICSRKLWCSDNLVKILAFFVFYKPQHTDWWLVHLHIQNKQCARLKENSQECDFFDQLFKKKASFLNKATCILQPNDVHEDCSPRMSESNPYLSFSFIVSKLYVNFCNVLSGNLYSSGADLKQSYHDIAKYWHGQG